MAYDINLVVCDVSVKMTSKSLLLIQVNGVHSKDVCHTIEEACYTIEGHILRSHDAVNDVL